MTTDEQKDEQFYRDTESIAFPKLDDHQLSLLEPLGKRRVLSRGELIFKAGQRDLGLTVTLRGEIEVFALRDGTETNLATSHERGFIGDVAMLQRHIRLSQCTRLFSGSGDTRSAPQRNSGVRSPNCQA